MILKNSDYNSFTKRVIDANKKIIVYGAGMIGQIIIPYLIDKYGLGNRLDCFIDADIRKKGSAVNVCGKEHLITTPDYLESIDDNYVLLITNSKFFSIIRTLDGIKNLDRIESYIVPMMQIHELKQMESITIWRRTEEQLIPKKIHYCWFGRGELPDFLKECIESWNVYCPDYEIIEWNEDNYDVNRHEYTKEAYMHKKYGFVSDLARLDILYENGGIYLDTDVTLVKNLDDLLYQPGFIGVEKWGNINTGGGCGFIKGHPMLKKMIAYRDSFHFELPDGTLNIDTNGMYETRPFLDAGFKPCNAMQVIEDVTIYPAYVNHPYDYMSCEMIKKEATISIHHFYGGWMEDDDRDNREDTQKQYADIIKRMNVNNVVEITEEPINIIRRIYSWLCDKESKDIYLNRLNFVISNDYLYIQNIIHKYVPDMAALNDKAIPNLLNHLPNDKDIILYGAGEDARANLCYFVNDKRFKGFCDRNVIKQKTGVDGYNVISPEELLCNPDCSIVISTHRGYRAIKEYLLNNGVEESRIHQMTPYMFATQEQQYFNPDFMSFEDEGEVFVDAGCCDMTTTLKLSKHCKLKRAYAFEPDYVNYSICKNTAEKEFESGVVKLIQKGTWSSTMTLRFDSSSDGASHVSGQGDSSIDVTTIDEVVDENERITFIKMDVEGSELESLKGARDTIKRCKPKLAICIYHKPEDMVEIPIYIKSLVPEYKLYIRHHSNGEGETVLYAIP